MPNFIDFEREREASRALEVAFATLQQRFFACKHFESL